MKKQYSKPSVQVIDLKHRQIQTAKSGAPVWGHPIGFYLGCRSAYSRATSLMQGQAFCGLRS